MNPPNFNRWLVAFIFAVTICLLLLGNLPGPSAQTKDPSKPQPDFTFGVIYRQTNLVSDLPGVALTEDPLLVNPWGVTRSSSGPFWIVNNVRPYVTFYQGDVSGGPLVKNSNPQAVAIDAPLPSSSPLPTAVVANTTNEFVVSLTPTSPAAPAQFIFASETGGIGAWQSLFGSASVSVKTVPGHHYTGLATGANASGNLLYAADFLNGKIDVFDKNFNSATVPGGFADVSIPASYHPFNIQNFGGSLYVSYADFNQFTNRPNIGSGSGFVRKFNSDGVRDMAFAISGGVLDAPWGMVVAPAASGPLSGKLIVGNSGSIGPFEPSLSAFDATTGALSASMTDSVGPYLKIDNLWGLVFGNGVNGGDTKTLYFTAGIFSQHHGLFGSLTPIITNPPPTIKFSATDYFASENAGHIDITVTLSGIFGTPISVNYATVDGDAFQGYGYEMALGKLTFQPGESTKTFRVLIIDNHQFAGGTRTLVNLVLSNPTGAGADLTSPRNAQLSIMDDEGDTPGQPPNTSDDPQLFVREQYFDFLNREPDTAGFNFWLNQITSCGSDQQCIEKKRINVSAAFFLSIEFQNTGMLAYLTHGACGFGFPRYGQFEKGIQQLQRNYVFGAPGADAQLEANKQAFFNDFALRPEFVAKFSQLSNAQYVDSLIQNTGVQFAQSERDAMVNGLNNMTETRATVLRRVAEKDTFKQAEFNRAFVLMQYFGYLRRNPDDLPDHDFSGYNFWLNKLNSFNGNFVSSDMVKSFLVSSEYRSRFGPP